MATRRNAQVRKIADRDLEAVSTSRCTVGHPWVIRPSVLGVVLVLAVVAGAVGFAGLKLLHHPSGVTVDSQGRVYIADTDNNVIQMAYRRGGNNYLEVVAGARQPCHLQDYPNCNDGHKATDAYLTDPRGVVLDAFNDMYIADTGDNVIRYVDGKTDTITLLAGSYGQTCSKPTDRCGDGGPATEATLNTPMGISLDSQGNAYIADTFDNRIRCVAAVVGGCVSGSQVGYIYTVAGRE